MKKQGHELQLMAQIVLAKNCLIIVFINEWQNSRIRL